MNETIGEITEIETIFWDHALSAPPLVGFGLTQDVTDRYTLLLVSATIEDALDKPPADYPGTYQDYVCALAAAANREIGSWGRVDEFGRSCQRLVLYPSLARYVEVDDVGDPPSVLVNAVGARLKSSLWWAVLKKLMVVPVEDSRRALSQCAMKLGLTDSVGR